MADRMLPVCQAIDGTPIAFTGKVVDAGPASGREPHWYRVRVLERFRGIDQSITEVNVLTAAETSCFQLYMVGREYLFLPAHLTAAGRSRRFLPSLPLETPVIGGAFCSPHRPVEYARDDIAFLRRGLSPVRLYGAVFAGNFNIPSLNLVSPPLKGATIRVSGPNGKAEQSTDERGKFRFDDVAPGTYTISASLAGYRFNGPIEVSAPPNGCGTAYFGAEGDAVIMGRVIHFDGTPAPGFQVDAVFPDSHLRASSIGSATTGTNGAFRLPDVNAGEVLVTVGWRSVRHRVGTIYWPGVMEAGKAGRLRIKPGEVRREIVIRLPKPADTRRVRVKVTNPDGSIAPEARVGVGHPNTAVNEDGVAELELFAGTPYKISAEAYVRGTGDGSVEISSTATQATIVLK